MKPANKAPSKNTDDLTQKLIAGRGRIGTVPLWTTIIGILAVGIIYAVLPPNLRIGPNWLLLVIEAVMLLPLVITIWVRPVFSHRAIRASFLILLGLLTLALIIGVVLLIITLPADKHATNLLRSAALLWSFNVLVFALWYWEIDGGGPLKRHLSGHQAADFMFPQQAKGNTSGWAPHFLDYLFLAFTGATALSPADTYPLTRTAKALMMIEAIISVTVIVILVGRGVNILGS
jgi:hypothetical protein